MRTPSEEAEEAEESVRIRQLLSQTMPEKYGSRVSLYSGGPVRTMGSAKVNHQEFSNPVTESLA
jgi:hypothetical protein